MRTFISYSKKTRKIEGLTNDLIVLKQDVWFDKELRGGDVWWDKILKEICDAELFIFAVSQKSLASKACLSELRYANALHKSILPIIVGPPGLINNWPTELSRRQYIDYRKQDKDGYKALQKALAETPAPKPLPDPLPEKPSPPELPKQSYQTFVGCFLVLIVVIAGVTWNYFRVPEEIVGKYGAPMVLVEKGVFTMGSPFDSVGEEPEHSVYLDAFYVDKFEVTVERYNKFLDEANHEKPWYWDRDHVSINGTKPVIGIMWYDARDYCVLAKKRLPTEAEWEKAARGTDKRKYPWGNEEPNSKRANFGTPSKQVSNTYLEALKPVGSYEQGKSPYGVYDMAGNVWEWVSDWYSETYYSKSPKKNPKGPTKTEAPWVKDKVLRGGSWTHPPPNLRSAYRGADDPTNSDQTYGFRCAQDAP